jgi:acyl-[acyl-carrier-protein]-phospholipid O-acyltransferase/long-chain-fatty-acid--[acyl-carrier-protein] ligase
LTFPHVETVAMSLETAVQSVSAAEVGPDHTLTPLPAHWRSLARAFVHQVRTRPRQVAMVDSTGASLTYGATFLRALALGRALSRELGPEPYVGVMLPPTVPAAVVNIALTLLGKIPINLNYTASQNLVNASIEQAGVARVLTSQRVLDKFKLQVKGPLLLEEMPKKVTLLDKAQAATIAKVVPIAALGAVLPGLRNDRLDDQATVIFTSGSTGDPKGVVLSNRNILSNIHAIDTHLHLDPSEVVLGVLPFFHSMGFTVTLWTVLCLGKTSVFHFNPLDARIVGGLCQTHKVSLLIGTPTFMRAYLSRCGPEQFTTAKRVILGAEKLKPGLATEIRETLGVEPLEGYGCTELSPVVAVNVDHDLTTRDGRTVPGNRLGTVGMPLPGTSVRTVDPETGDVLPRGTEGLVEVKGPQVMVGYLNRPEATAKVLRDGWYSTGDLGMLDADGFLTITDRLSRFSKIGGEMVPHLGVEAALMHAAGVDETCVAVTSLPDVKRGERLVVLYTNLNAAPEEIYHRLTAGSLPKLWIPSADAFVQVDALPVLGTGKLDLRQLRQIARERLDA